ncbi:MAG: phospholipid carrier-dependent glycosyltransferase, partial [Chloroflexota bacterium]
ASQIICLPGLLRRHAPKVSSIVAVFLLFWLAVEALAIQPYPLAYFNQLVGGPAQGYRVLADSNLDWGQDLKRLAAVLKAQGIERPW